MKEELHVALRALEKNLKDIQSANESVKEIRNLAHSDIKAAGNVVKAIDEELKKLEVEFKKSMLAFEKESKETIKGVEVKTGAAVKEMMNLNDSLKGHIDSNVESLSQSNRLLFQKYDNAWEKHNQELNRVFLKFEELKQSVEKLKTEINEVDFPNKLNKISASISGLEGMLESQNNLIEEGNSKQGSNFMILAVIGAVIIVLQLISFFVL
jgi:uncharacterized protein YukE